MESKIINKAHEFFNNIGKYPNMIKINPANADLFTTFQNFRKNTTIPFGIGEISGMAVVCTQDDQDRLSENTIQFWVNGELLGDMSLSVMEEPKKYMYTTITGVYPPEVADQILNKWQQLGFLDNLNNELKYPVSSEMEKINQFLNSLHGKYFIDEIENIVFPIIKKLLTLETNNVVYNFNVYDLLLFTNFYYPQIKQYIDDIASKTPERTFDTVLETCLILSEYYEYFLNGKGFTEFLQSKH